MAIFIQFFSSFSNVFLLSWNFLLQSNIFTWRSRKKGREVLIEADSEMEKVIKIGETHFWPKKISTKNVPRMTQNSPKKIQNCPKWTKNYLKLPKMDQKDLKLPKMAQNFFHLWADSNSPLLSSLTSSYCHKTWLFWIFSTRQPGVFLNLVFLIERSI